MLTLTALGLRIAVDLTGVTAAEQEDLRVAWASCDARVVDGPDGEPVDNEIRASRGDRGDSDGGSDLIATSHAELADALTSLVTLRAISARSDDLLLFHGSALADPRTGAVIAFVGPSGRGKTTLARHLGRRYVYVTDECVAVSPRDLSVTAYPKPLSVIVPGTDHPFKHQMSPRELGLVPLNGVDLRLAAIVLLDREPAGAAGRVRVDRVPFMDGIPDLVPQISFLTKRPRPLASLRGLLDGLGGLRAMHYGEIAHVDDVVRELFAEAEQAGTATLSAPQPAAAEDIVAIAAEDIGAHGTRAGLTSYRQAPADDAIASDGRVAIVATGRLVTLDGIGPAIWRACERGATRDEIAGAVVAEFGEPSDDSAGQIVAREVARLVDMGILEERRATSAA